MTERLKAYALDFAKAVIAAAIAAAVAYLGNLDLGEIIGAGAAGGVATAFGPRDKQRRRRLPGK